VAQLVGCFADLYGGFVHQWQHGAELCVHGRDIAQRLERAADGGVCAAILTVIELHQGGLGGFA